jgi:heat shock protein HslJ
MRLAYLSFILLPFSLAACQANDIENVKDHTIKTLKNQTPSRTLSSYTWQTNTGAKKPLTLNFGSDGTLGVSTTCNSLSTTWRVESNELVTGNTMMTQMACSNADMRQEAIAGKLLSKRNVPFIINTQSGENPTLTLMDITGKRYLFTGIMTPETRYQGEGQTMFYEIHPQTKTCTGLVQQQCLQVKEIRYNQQGLKTYQDANWSLFYGQIQGYEHNPRERQVIRVKRFEVKNPAADQSKYAYVHDMTIERGLVK